MKLLKLRKTAKLRTLSALLVLLIGIGFIIYNFGITLDGLEKLLKSARLSTFTTNESMSVHSFWDDSLNDVRNIPTDLRTRAEEVVIIEKSVLVDNVIIFYRESSPSVAGKVALLLLHGKNFSSKTWLDLKTIALFTSAGYRTIAVDLPGFGNSDKLPATGQTDKSKFLFDLITKLEISKPVIVSPSYSGCYTLPLLAKNWKLFTGYVPVAPVGQEVIESYNSCHHRNTTTDNIIMKDRFNRLPYYFKEQVKNSLPDVSCIITPVLVIHGEFDRSKSSALLSLLPNAKTFEIPQGKHSCYLQNPDLFHAVIYDFLSRLIERESS